MVLSFKACDNLWVDGRFSFVGKDLYLQGHCDVDSRCAVSHSQSPSPFYTCCNLSHLDSLWDIHTEILMLQMSVCLLGSKFQPFTMFLIGIFVLMLRVEGTTRRK